MKLDGYYDEIFLKNSHVIIEINELRIKIKICLPQKQSLLKMNSVNTSWENKEIASKRRIKQEDVVEHTKALTI